MDLLKKGREVGGALAGVGFRSWRSLVMPIDLVRANEQLRSKPLDKADAEALTEDDLKALIDTEWTRAKELDDKLQKLTAALSVAVTVGGLVGTTMLQDLAASGWKLAAAVLFVAAVILLVTGVILGFNGLRPKPRYGYGAGYLRVIAAGGAKARKELVSAAASFQRDNAIRANEASAATSSIRNGVLFFVAAVLIGMVAAASGKAQQPGQAGTIVDCPLSIGD